MPVFFSVGVESAGSGLCGAAPQSLEGVSRQLGVIVACARRHVGQLHKIHLARGVVPTAVAKQKGNDSAWELTMTRVFTYGVCREGILSELVYSSSLKVITLTSAEVTQVTSSPVNQLTSKIVIRSEPPES